MAASPSNNELQRRPQSWHVLGLLAKLYYNVVSRGIIFLLLPYNPGCLPSCLPALVTFETEGKEVRLCRLVACGVRAVLCVSRVFAPRSAAPRSAAPAAGSASLCRECPHCSGSGHGVLARLTRRDAVLC